MPWKVRAAVIILRIRRRKQTENITVFEWSAAGKASEFRRRRAILRISANLTQVRHNHSLSVMAQKELPDVSIVYGAATRGSGLEHSM